MTTDRAQAAAKETMDDISLAATHDIYFLTAVRNPQVFSQVQVRINNAITAALASRDAELAELRARVNDRQFHDWLERRDEIAITASALKRQDFGSVECDELTPGDVWCVVQALRKLNEPEQQ